MKEILEKRIEELEAAILAENKENPEWYRDVYIRKIIESMESSLKTNKALLLVLK